MMKYQVFSVLCSFDVMYRCSFNILFDSKCTDFIIIIVINNIKHIKLSTLKFHIVLNGPKLAGRLFLIQTRKRVLLG